MKCDFCGIELEYIVEPKKQFTIFGKFVRWISGLQHYYLRCPGCGSMYCSKCGLVHESHKNRKVK